MFRKGILLLLLFTMHFAMNAQSFVVEKGSSLDFPVSTVSEAASIYVDAGEDSLLHIAASLLQTDIEKVTGGRPQLISSITSATKNLIVIGTANSQFISKLASERKINLNRITGQWETFILQTVNRPFTSVNNALLIIGSDRRGAAYGALELSKQMGVSPWYWWADVSVKKKKEIYFRNGTYHYPSPSVKYRGIFINDEAPAFSGWTYEKFGGFNSKMYVHMFELLLRLKANYLWPAMWGNAFNDDDTLNPVLANKWGIVMGTSHHEPMLRAQTEWKRYGKGEWNYEKNEGGLKSFWKKGIENMRGHESIVTWNVLLKKAEALYIKTPNDQKDAFYQLVLHPVKAYATLQNMYTALAWNQFYAEQNNLLANKYAEEVKRFYLKDSLIAVEYHHINNGKWNHMMSQKHIAYTSWQEPKVQRMPDVKYVYANRSDGTTTFSSSSQVLKSTVSNDRQKNVFYEEDGYVSIDGASFTRKVDGGGIEWKIIPGIGREGSGITTFPVIKSIGVISKTTPHLQYDFFTTDPGSGVLNTYISPTLNFPDSENGLQYAVSIDDGTPQVVSINKFRVDDRRWAQAVSNNINITATSHNIGQKGKHTLKYWMISPGVVLQKLVLDLGGLKPSYLGPPTNK